MYLTRFYKISLRFFYFQYTKRTIKEYIMENVTIRKTKFEDLEKIAYIYEQAFGDKTLLPKMKRKFKQLENNKDYIFISAIYENTCVGFCQLVIHQDITETTMPFSTLWSFVVNADYRGKGIGTKMLQFAEHESKKRKCAFIKLTTTNERKACVTVCKKLGYNESLCFSKYF